MKKVGLKVFSIFYRKVVLENIKSRFLCMIKMNHIICLCRRNNHSKPICLTPWDSFLERQLSISYSEECSFYLALMRLKSYIMSKNKNEELFEEIKYNISMNRLINEETYREFKEWLEKTNYKEKDCRKVEEVINSFIPKY